MNEFWAFAQNYWWLAFPIMAVAGGFARRWEFSARARHKRRLEILQAADNRVKSVRVWQVKKVKPDAATTE